MAITSAVRSVIVPSGVQTSRFTIRVTFNSAVQLTRSDIKLTPKLTPSSFTYTIPRSGASTTWNIEIRPPTPSSLSSVDQTGTLNIVLGEGGQYEYHIPIQYDLVSLDTSDHRTVFYKISAISFPSNLRNLDIIYTRSTSSSIPEITPPSVSPLRPRFSEVLIPANWTNLVPSGTGTLYAAPVFISGTSNPYTVSYGNPFKLDEDINGTNNISGIWIFATTIGRLKRATLPIPESNPIERGFFYHQNNKIWVEEIVVNHIDPGFNQINISTENRGSVIHEALDGTRTRVKGLNDREKHTIQFSGTSWPRDLVQSLQTFYNNELSFGFSHKSDIKNETEYPDHAFPAIFENLELNTSYSATYTGTGYNIQFTVTEQ